MAKSEREALLKERCISASPEKEELGHWEAAKMLWHQDCCPCLPARYILAVMSFFGFVIVYALRVNLSMAIVAMVSNSSNETDHDHFNWTSTQQGWILSAFFYGYIITQIPGGFLAGVIGGKLVLGLGIVITAALSLLTPLAARIHFGALIGLRVLEGFFEGVTFPAMHAMWGKWAPPAERSILTTITYAGPFFGNVISFPLSAVLCVYGFAGGWPSVFYTFGILGIIWYIFWLLLIFDSPAKHPRISEREKEYIEGGIADANVGSEKVPVPWLQIFASPAVWGIIAAHVSVNWGNYIMLTCIPSYFHDALGLSLGENLIQNGIFSAIPYVGFVISTIIAGQVADFLRKRWISTKNVRKGITLIALVSGAAGLLVTGYFGKKKLDSVIFLTISVGGVGLANAGFNINHIDIAPRFAGVLMGITNCAATIPGIVAPTVAKYIAQKPPDGPDQRHLYQAEWREVFIIAAEVYLFGAAVYLILAEGTKQWWADGVKRAQKETKDELIVSQEQKTTIQEKNGTLLGNGSR